MIKKKPRTETERLAALHALGILDTGPEERFDRLTRLARQCLDAPIALIVLVDEHRLWFKSCLGLDITETPRELSFCAHTLLKNEIFEVPDARIDHRFKQHPLVAGSSNIRFYAGVPLLTEDGLAIGTFCIMSREPKRLTPEQRKVLSDLSACTQEIMRLVARSLLICRNISEIKSAETALERQKHIAEIISRAQSQFILESNRSRAFDELLSDILNLTGSEYGFIAEILHREDGSPYLKTRAITNIAWNDETRAFYEANAAQGMEFSNLKNLFGAVIVSEKPLIANNPEHDPRRGGLPPGHPPLKSFLGIPVHYDRKLVAMIGVANRPGGYESGWVKFLHPLLMTLGQLIEAARVKRLHDQNQAELTRLSRVASQTTNGVIITDTEGRVEWINEGFTRLSGYSLKEMLGRKPGDLLQGEATDPEVAASMHRALIKRQSFTVDVVNYHKSGQAYWVRIQCNPLYDTQGALQGFMAIESDISREKNDAERILISQRRLTATIEGTHIGTWEWNVQTGQTVFNERWAEIVGYTLSELEPISIETWLKLTHPDDLQLSERLLQRHFAGELEFYDAQCRMRHKKGHWVWVHDRGRVVNRTNDGKPLMMYGTHADISEQKMAMQALNDSETRLRGLFELSPVGIALNDYATGRFVEVNNALLAPTGYSREEFLSLSYFEITPQEYEAQEKQQSESMKNTGRYGPYEKEYIKKNGDRYPVLLNGMVVEDLSGKKMIWSIIEDISERKRNDRMKNEFISTVSHELRTPLTAIAGSLGLLAGGALGELPGTVDEIVAIAYKNSRRLSLLINDLLDMEKLIAGKLNFDLRPQALMPLVEQALDDNQTYADQFGVILRITQRDDALHVDVDAQRIQQIFANLLSNAAKFSPKGGTVDIAVLSTGNLARIEVSDRGPGIPATFRKHIFQKFAQADASDSRKKGGTGLGLAITKELVERMNGNIGYESEPDKATTFFITLPIVAGDSSKIAS
ncbi:PAS domain S-box protein [Methylotuvimicrobium sp. KM2]|uniref:PAS domain S-box protein n=1 Tax=Methylotuvimicrobium sp. KM2 TaxID=3133976 RepID=UPI00310192B3